MLRGDSLALNDPEGSLEPSPGGQSIPPVPPSLGDVNHVISYVKKVCGSLLDEEDMSSTGCENLSNVLKESADSIKKFISDPQAKSLFIQKISNKGMKRDYSSKLKKN